MPFRKLHAKSEWDEARPRATVNDSHGRSKWRTRRWPWFALSAPLLLTACRGLPAPQERVARQEVQEVHQVLKPGSAERQLPVLHPGSTMEDYVRFAMLNDPSVEAAYFDWAASVERITVERSLPDPRLTFQADIASIVMSVMPGLMQDFPGPGKLQAAAHVATAGSHTKYYAFESAVLRAAFNLKKVFYQLAFLDEQIRIDRQTLDLLAGLERIARAQNEVGKVTLQDVYRARIERDRLATELANLEDSRHSLMAQFKGTLGLRSDQPDPPPPSKVESTPLDLTEEQVLASAYARNPQLKGLEAEVSQAEAAVAMAGKSKVPDFSVGLMAEAQAAPTFYRPLATMSLPIWRDKIAAQIAAAKAEEQAARARFTEGQITLAVDFAMKSYDYREATRNLALLQNQLLPESRTSLEIARAAYLSGQISFFNLLDTERTWLGFQLQEVQERARREIVLADISLSIAGIAPSGAPVLGELRKESGRSPAPGAAHP